jgi:hypothetical protein
MYPTCTVPTRLALSYWYRIVLTNWYRANLYWPYGYRTVLTNRYLYRTNLAIERHRRDAVGDADGLTVQKDIGEQSNNLI